MQDRGVVLCELLLSSSARLEVVVQRVFEELSGRGNPDSMLAAAAAASAVRAAYYGRNDRRAAGRRLLHPCDLQSTCLLLLPLHISAGLTVSHRKAAES